MKYAPGLSRFNPSNVLIFLILAYSNIYLFLVERAWSALTHSYTDLVLDPDGKIHSFENMDSTTRPSNGINVDALNSILTVAAEASESFAYDGYLILCGSISLLIDYFFIGSNGKLLW